MFGIRYIKGSPATYLAAFRKGKPVREGVGISFFYFAPVSTLVSVPVKTTDLPFVFNETTLDLQPVTVQGVLTYRIAQPGKIAGLLDFTIDEKGAFRSDDPEQLKERLIHATQAVVRSRILELSLSEALKRSQEISQYTVNGMKEHPVAKMLGIEILSVSIGSVKAAPETTKALEAQTREKIQQAADQAIYERRNNAIEQERRIRESEAETEIVVEKRRTELLTQKLENDKSEADAKAYALDTGLKPLKGVDWKTLMAAQSGNLDAGMMVALAFRELAENAGKIGELNVSSELLQSLVHKEKKRVG